MTDKTTYKVIEVTEQGRILLGTFTVMADAIHYQLEEAEKYTHKTLKRVLERGMMRTRLVMPYITIIT